MCEYRHYDEIGVYQTRTNNVNESIVIEQLQMILYVPSTESWTVVELGVTPISSNAPFLGFLISSCLQYIPYENKTWGI